MIAYHDEEWGVPVHDDPLLFEFLTLEGAQAGLSWMTILKKRENYRKAFAGFEIEKVARFRPPKVEKLMQDAGIVRNRMKIESTLQNAKAVLKIERELGSFDAYIWGFVDHATVVNRFKSMRDLPAKTDTSKAMSKDLLTRGFRFVGPTICYAFMQATGMVNDHVVSCPRHRELVKI